MTHPRPDMLAEPFPLTSEQKEHYAEHGFIQLKGVLPADVIDHFNDVISAEVARLTAPAAPLNERDTYGKAFIQVTNLWTRSEAVRPLVFSRRLARIATSLMQVDGVRLYHDQALFKEPGGGHTPWHADQYYWPLATEKCTTAWIPLQETGLEMGPLEFSAGSHRLESGRDLAISDASEAEMAKTLDRGPYRHVVQPFDIGDVSFHAGWVYHRAGPNTTSNPRKAMTIIYMDKDMRLAEPAHADQELDRDVFCPGIPVGHVVDSHMNPEL